MHLTVPFVQEYLFSHPAPAKRRAGFVTGAERDATAPSRMRAFRVAARREARSREVVKGRRPADEVGGPRTQQCAIRYLDDGELHVSKIAWLLGYQEVGAFTHAFKRWTGKTPSEMRRIGA